MLQKQQDNNYRDGRFKNHSIQSIMNDFCTFGNCLHLDPDVNLEIAVKLRPYSGIIGIDTSSLDGYLKSFKVLRLHAILHASGFIAEYSQKGPGYSYVLP